jgi:AraC-like DNA-binding protein
MAVGVLTHACKEPLASLPISSLLVMALTHPARPTVSPRWTEAMPRSEFHATGAPGAISGDDVAFSTAGGLSASRERLVKQLILANLASSLEVTALADACSLSRSHFSRAFKCSTGLSPREWIQRQRIARAKELIRRSELSLIQIGLECGFCDQAHFCRSFSRSVGVTPLTWRLGARLDPNDSATRNTP